MGSVASGRLGTTTIDILMDSSPELEAFVDRATAARGSVVAPPRDMEWGQRYAIVADPDGYRWGLKADLAR